MESILFKTIEERGDYMDRAKLDIDSAEKQFAEQAYLMYFNKFLLESGIITVSEFKHMLEKIAAKGSRVKKLRYFTG